ncbi:MAG: prepilin-type N-terminal cleavage/methylation domain-containing protein [Gemmatimonadales bacterium]
MRNRKGYTLIELMVALVVLVLVTGSLYKLLVSQQRLARAQAERVDLQSNVRTASLVIPAELRELNTVVGGLVPQNDIISMTATTIRYRAMRGIGYICQTPTISEIRVLASTWSGLRNPVAVRDAGYVFYDLDDSKSSDDTWLPILITGVNTASTCGGNAAYSLTIAPTVGALPTIPLLTPVRLYEVMELSLYTNAGQSWLGAQSVSGGELAPQPLLGPLAAAAADGLKLEYLDNSNVATTNVNNVKSIKLTVVGLTNQAIAKTGGSSQTSVVYDTLVTQVALRNSFRP